MRLIDADELIIFGLDNPDDEHLFQFVPMEIIDSAPTVELPSAQRWIPCSERLPDYHDEVLVTSLGEVAIAWLYLDGNWRSNDMPEPMYKYIVAWMPLPNPWRGEEDETD